MIYLYVVENEDSESSSIVCSECEKRKQELKEQGLPHEIRDGERLKGGHKDWDDVDLDALVKFTMQDRTFPVEVERSDESE